MKHNYTYDVLKNNLNSFCKAEKGTGRTTNILNSQKDGDIYVTFYNDKYSYNFIRENNLDVRVINAKTLSELKTKTTGITGNLVLDHSFIENVFCDALIMAKNDIDLLVDKISN